jgi:hypothetical protein
MVNSDELLGTTEYLTLYTWCRITDVVITGFDLFLTCCITVSPRLSVCYPYSHRAKIMHSYSSPS